MILKGKTAVVIGASGGIGREIVKLLARERVNIVMVARRKAILLALGREVGKCNIKTYMFIADVSKTRSIVDLSKRLDRHFNEIDMLFNAAGIGIYKKLKDLTLDDWEKSLKLNVTAPCLTIQKLMPLLEKSGRAVVINFGSGMGRVGLSGRSAYCASKFALRGLTLSLAKEYKDTDVRICLATLGSVLTGFGPLTVENKIEKIKKGKEYLKPAEVAHAIISKIKNDTLGDEFSIYPKDYYKESKKDKR